MVWNTLVHTGGNRWQRTLLNWVGSARQLNHPLLVVHYEDLLADTVKEVSRMLDFLHQDYSRTELATKLKDGYGKFHRSHSAADDYDHYTKDQRLYINSMITSTESKLQQTHNEQLHLMEYIS